MTSPLPTDEDREALASIITWTDWPDWNNLTVDQGEIIADAILAAGFRRSVVSTPSEPVAYAIYGRVTGNLKYVEVLDPHEVKEQSEFYDVVPLYRSAVSAPPTITDEMVERAAFASFALDGGSERSRSIWHAMSVDARESARASARAALRAALGGEA